MYSLTRRHFISRGAGDERRPPLTLLQQVRERPVRPAAGYATCKCGQPAGIRTMHAKTILALITKPRYYSTLSQ